MGATIQFKCGHKVNIFGFPKEGERIICGKCSKKGHESPRWRRVFHGKSGYRVIGEW